MVGNIDAAFTYIFMWNSLSDACPRCRALNGREWQDQDLFADVLIDPQFGPIWDLNQDISLMHGASGTCRCQLTVRVEVDLTQVEEFRQLSETLKVFA